MTEVRRLREARKSQLQREQQLQARGRELEEERASLEQRLRDQQQAQERCQRLREDWEASSLELLRLKDENYMIAMRLAQLSEEKNSAVLRSRDLQLAVGPGEGRRGRVGRGEGATFAKTDTICWLSDRGAGPFPVLCLSFLTCNVGMLVALISLTYDGGFQLGVTLPTPGKIWLCLETCLVVTARRLLSASSGWSPGMF